MNPSGGGWIIFLSLVVALIFSLLHLPESWPAWLGWFRPQWLLLVLFFWIIEVPHRIGLIGVWCFGFLVDVLYADPLGLNGIILASLTYIGWRFFERLRMYSVVQQAGVLFFFIFGAQLLRVFVLGYYSEREWGWNIVVTPLASVVFWPLIFLFLLRIRTGARIE